VWKGFDGERSSTTLNSDHSGWGNEGEKRDGERSSKPQQVNVPRFLEPEGQALRRTAKNNRRRGNEAEGYHCIDLMQSWVRMPGQPETDVNN
jgi:hypothetical protein